MKCIYCGIQELSEMYVVEEAVKPKNTPYRWKEIGHCCDDCYAKGKPVRIETVK